MSIYYIYSETKRKKYGKNKITHLIKLKHYFAKSWTHAIMHQEKEGLLG